MTDEASHTVAEVLEPAADPTRASRGMLALLIGVFLSVAVAAALVFVPLPYAVLSPGPVTDTLGSVGGTKIIDVTAPSSYPTGGKLFFTTVRVSGGPGYPVTIYDLISAWSDPNAAVRPESDLFPEGATQQQVQQENAAEMVDSQQVAAAVAARAIGKTVPVTVTVAEVVPGSAAVGLVQKGDVIVSVDGRQATAPSEVRAAVRAHKPGDGIPIVLRRGGEELTVTPVAKAADGATVIGVQMSGTYQLPISITFHPGNVGGPSAGLMFTLAIYDLLTPGELTGGTAIAGTGTIADDGSVGPIGGIAQKMAGAKRGGAVAFLAPAANCPDVVGHVPDGLQVVKVSTFDEARTAVEAIGKGQATGLPTCAR